MVSISLPSRKTYKIKKRMAERMRVVWPRNMVSELFFCGLFDMVTWEYRLRYYRVSYCKKNQMSLLESNNSRKCESCVNSKFDHSFLKPFFKYSCMFHSVYVVVVISLDQVSRLELTRIRLGLEYFVFCIGDSYSYS